MTLQKPIQSEGNGTVRLYDLDSKNESIPHNVHGLPTVKIMAQVEAIKSEIIIIGGGTVGVKETAVLTQNENITTLADFQCEGRMLPDSNQASVTFTAKLEDGETVRGGGVFFFPDVNNLKANAAFDCTMDGKGGVTYLANIEDMRSVQVIHIIFAEVVINTEDGRSFSIESPAISGFHMGEGGVPF